MKVWILNNTAYHDHAGCKLTMQMYERLCAEHGIEIVGTCLNGADLTPHYKDFEKADLLIVNAEGSIHHNSNLDLIRIASKFPSVLINGVYESNVPLPALKDFLYIAMRESASANAVRAAGAQCDIVPDICFACQNVKGVRKDILGKLGVTDSVLDPNSGNISIRCAPTQYMQRLSDFEKLICGRFHAVVFASLLEIPFSAYASNTWKISALMADMGVSDLYAPSKEEAIPLAPESFPDEIRLYKRHAPFMIDEMFRKVKNLI